MPNATPEQLDVIKKNHDFALFVGANATTPYGDMKAYYPKYQVYSYDFGLKGAFPGGQRYWTTGGLKFEKDWNWLMLVYFKVREEWRKALEENRTALLLIKMSNVTNAFETGSMKDFYLALHSFVEVWNTYCKVR